jgi:hypothetical protein
VRIYDGIIVRTRGPLPGKIHDKKFAEYYQIQNDLDPDEWALGDAGYQGMPKFIVPFKGELDDGQKESNKFLGRLRVIVERVYSEIKKFAVFEHPWRGKIPNQKLLLHVMLLTLSTTTTRLSLTTNKYLCNPTNLPFCLLRFESCVHFEPFKARDFEWFDCVA